MKRSDDLYLNELRDLYSAETQLLEALPKMAEAATASQLKEAFLAHLEETYGHGRRLEEIFNAWGEEPSGETCKAIEGLIQEGEDYAKAGGDVMSETPDHWRSTASRTLRSKRPKRKVKNCSSVAR